MSKTVTLRLDEDSYTIFKSMAERENRSLSNFIETATLRFIEEHEEVDEFELAEIKSNRPLIASLKRGLTDAKNRSGRFV